LRRVGVNNDHDRRANQSVTTCTCGHSRKQNRTRTARRSTSFIAITAWRGRSISSCSTPWPQNTQQVNASASPSRRESAAVLASDSPMLRPAPLLPVAVGKDFNLCTMRLVVAKPVSRAHRMILVAATLRNSTAARSTASQSNPRAVVINSNQPRGAENFTCPAQRMAHVFKLPSRDCGRPSHDLL